MMPSSELLSIGLLLLRLVLAVVFFAHGAQKALGWFGGYGPKGTYGWMTSSLKIPGPIAYVGVYAEFLASIGLFLGLFTHLAGLAIFIQMLVAIFATHLRVGLFMNWGSVADKGEGYEFSLTLAVTSFVVFLLGGGAYSLDALIW
jgi:putative oxidoreductase